MVNPHKRCKICKERHPPGNCKETGNIGPVRSSGGVRWMGLAEAIGDLWLSSEALVDYIENGAGQDPSINFKNGTVGGERLAKVKTALRRIVIQR